MVWDTGALTLFFSGNDSTKKLMEEIYSDKSLGYIPQLVYVEYYYKTWQKFGEQAAIVRTKTMRDSPLTELLLQESDTYVVGKLKIKYPFLSLVDAVVASVAQVKNSTIITSDADFLKVKEVRVKKIEY